MKITEDQLALFAQKSLADFRGRAVAHLRDISPDWGGVAESDLGGFVDRSIAHAQKLAITLEPDVIDYLELLYRIGPQRWRSPDYAWIGEYLGEAWPARDRLGLVFERLRFDERLPQ